MKDRLLLADRGYPSTKYFDAGSALRRCDSTISEFGDDDTFEIVLITQPTSDVTIPLESSDTTGG